MPELELSWLGPPVIELRGRPLKLETRKVTALLAYLSLHTGDVGRETLAAMFWPENDQQHAMGSLRRALWALSSCLDLDSLEIDRELVRLAGRSQIRVDVEDLRRQIATVRLHRPSDLSNSAGSLCPECLAALEEAIRLYRGDFLEGFNLKDCPEFDDWQTAQRENIRSDAAQALQWLVQGSDARQESEKAIQYARRWVALDRLEETAQRALIHLFAQSGQRSAALRQYENFARLLKDELGQSPETETAQLYERIRSGEETKAAEKPLRPSFYRAAEAEPLLKTKLCIPPLRVDRVSRPRLAHLLDSGAQRSLTLISAPAGFGKTTLLANWASTASLPIAWLSVDEGDNDPIRFVSYLIAALDTVLPGMNEQFQGFVQVLHPAIQPLLVRLLNRLAAEGKPFSLVLDDYQLIHLLDIHNILAFLLENMPACMHLVISTRTDPSLPLARLRVRDQLVEIRASDLRFTLEEAVSFLSQVMMLDINREDISALEARTEGWIAGLQMAALAIRTVVGARPADALRDVNDGQNITRFIQAFSGSHRFILDYLGEEVLGRRSEETRRFLLQTSILERLSGPLCDAVTGTVGSQDTLEGLEKENLFLVPLDHERHWYRYHHLFAELLRFQLEEAQSKGLEIEKRELASLDELHLRAANWFEEQLLPEEAVQHLLAARKYEQAAGLIESQAQNMYFISGQTYTLSTWLSALPPALFQIRARLNIVRAWMLISQNQFTGAMDALEAAGRIVKDQKSVEAENIFGEIALIEGVLAELSARDVVVMRKKALFAWEKLAPEDLMLRGLAAWLLGASYIWDGDARHAESYFTQAIQLCQEVGNNYITLVSTVDLAGVMRENGQLRKAYQLQSQTIQEITSGKRPMHPELGHLYIHASQILLQWNRLDEAEQQLNLGLELAAQVVPGEILIFGLGTLPYIKLAQGKREEALHTAEKCLAQIEAYSLPYVPSQTRANLIYLWIRLNERARIEEWLSQCGLIPDGPIRYRQEAEYIALAEALLWQGDGEGALKILAKLYETVKKSNRPGKLYLILALQALAYQQLNKLDLALESLASSLKLGQSEGYIRTYVDAGARMEKLLQAGAEKGLWSRAHLESYVKDLLAAFQQDANINH